jgi:hypothetical protein
MPVMLPGALLVPVELPEPPPRLTELVPERLAESVELPEATPEPADSEDEGPFVEEPGAKLSRPACIPDSRETSPASS